MKRGRILYWVGRNGFLCCKFTSQVSKCSSSVNPDAACFRSRWHWKILLVWCFHLLYDRKFCWHHSFHKAVLCSQHKVHLQEEGWQVEHEEEWSRLTHPKIFCYIQRLTSNAATPFTKRLWLCYLLASDKCSQWGGGRGRIKKRWRKIHPWVDFPPTISFCPFCDVFWKPEGQGTAWQPKVTPAHPTPHTHHHLAQTHPAVWVQMMCSGQAPQHLRWAACWAAPLLPNAARKSEREDMNQDRGTTAECLRSEINIHFANLSGRVP